MRTQTFARKQNPIESKTLVKMSAGGRRAGKPLTTESHFGHDFSRIPVHGGRTLPDDVRSDAERRLRRPFDAVRLHDDVAGGWTALAHAARAVTIGNHIYTAPGQLDAGGRSLLLHEIAHVASQDPALGLHMSAAPRSHPAEQFAREFAAGRDAAPPRAPVGIYRDPMLRADFDQQMKRFGVGRVFDGAFADQVQRLNHFSAGARHGDKLQQAAWAAWSPGADSSVYDWVLAAFTELAASFGGVPPVTELSFFATDYKLDNTGNLVPDGDVLASYGGGQMAFYQSAVTRATLNTTPAGRSSGAQAAPLSATTAEEGVKRTVTHELGHGLVETALTNRPGGGAAPDAAMLNDYKREVGWTAGASPQLFDAGVAAVRTALAAGTPPPAVYRITEATWNDPKWIEQPMTSYMTTHPSEDFPEAVAAYVQTPALLRQRSPRRFSFIDSRKAALAPFLTKDFSKLKLKLSGDELQNILGGPKPHWIQPLPQPAQPRRGNIQFGPGLQLEIRF